MTEEAQRTEKLARQLWPSKRCFWSQAEAAEFPFDLNWVFTCDEPGAYKVLVKVVDIFDNDTTKMVEITISEREA